MAANQILDPNHIRVGSTLRIPAPTTAGAGGATHHVVRPGGSLSAIAQRYGLSSGQLREWNGLSDVNSVWSGSRLSISGPAAPDLVTSAGGRTHRIAPGDTLSQIALRHGSAPASSPGTTGSPIRAGSWQVGP